VGYIAPGARLFGRISIGNNVKIGANAVIHKDVPDDVLAVLDPGFKIIASKKFSVDLDSTLVESSPVTDEILSRYLSTNDADLKD
jgi:serine acetyltransferase